MSCNQSVKLGKEPNIVANVGDFLHVRECDEHTEPQQKLGKQAFKYSSYRPIMHAQVF